jgi:hypothetical protein
VVRALTTRDAIAIALWNNDALQADLANLIEYARADLAEAKRFRNLNFSTLFPVCPRPIEFFLT